MRLLLVLLIALVSCQRDRIELGAFPGTFTRWEKQLNRRGPFPEEKRRQLASESETLGVAAPRCLRERLESVAFLETELEAMRGVTPRSGATEFLRRIGITGELGDLANRLAGFSEWERAKIFAFEPWISTEGIQFEGCTDLQCVIKRVYLAGGYTQEESSEAAVRIHYFYLKTGYVLSIRNRFPMRGGSRGLGLSQNRDIPLREYLFTPEELKQFVALSHMLNERHFFQLPTLSSLHRIPQSLLLDGRENLCGLASRRGDFGMIRYSGYCLQDLLSSNPQFVGTSSTLLLHEWSHSLAFALPYEVSSQGGSVSFEEGADWSVLSGWEREIVMDASADGERPVPRWRATPGEGRDGFVSSYAATSPAEDFADTLAFFRINPDFAGVVSPRKSEFISRRFFAGRKFNINGLAQHYQTELGRELRAALPSLLSELEQDRTPLEGSAPLVTFWESQLAQLERTSLSQESQQRLARRLASQQLRTWSRLFANDWEACGLSPAQRGEIDQRVATALLEELNLLTALSPSPLPTPLPSAGLLVDSVLGLRRELELRIFPMEVYLGCQAQAQAQAQAQVGPSVPTAVASPGPGLSSERCFDAALARQLDSVLSSQRSQWSDEQVSLERARFLEDHPWPRVRQRVEETLARVFEGAETALRASADSRFETCLSQARMRSFLGPGERPQTSEDPVVTPFSGGSQFVRADLLACLNQVLVSDVNLIRDRMVQRFGFELPDAPAQIAAEGVLLPHYLGQLQSRVESEAQNEERLRLERKSGLITVLISELQTDLTWVVGGIPSVPGVRPPRGVAPSVRPSEGVLPAEDSQRAACRARAGLELDQYLARVSVAQRPPFVFASYLDVRSQWANEACAVVLQSPFIRNPPDRRR